MKRYYCKAALSVVDSVVDDVCIFSARVWVEEYVKALL